MVAQLIGLERLVLRSRGGAAERRGAAVQTEEGQEQEEAAVASAGQWYQCEEEDEEQEENDEDKKDAASQVIARSVLFGSSSCSSCGDGDVVPVDDGWSVHDCKDDDDDDTDTEVEDESVLDGHDGGGECSRAHRVLEAKASGRRVSGHCISDSTEVDVEIALEGLPSSLTPRLAVDPPTSPILLSSRVNSSGQETVVPVETCAYACNEEEADAQARSQFVLIEPIKTREQPAEDKTVSEAIARSDLVNVCDASEEVKMQAPSGLDLFCHDHAGSTMIGEDRASDSSADTASQRMPVPSRGRTSERVALSLMRRPPGHSARSLGERGRLPFSESQSVAASSADQVLDVELQDRNRLLTLRTRAVNSTSAKAISSPFQTSHKK